MTRLTAARPAERSSAFLIEYGFGGVKRRCSVDSNAAGGTQVRGKDLTNATNASSAARTNECKSAQMGRRRDERIM